MSTTTARFRVCSALLLIALLLLTAGAITSTVRAQPAPDAAAGSSFLTPFPDNDIYQVTVYGDALADGLLAGLVDALGTDGRLQIQRRVRTLPSAARTDPDDDLRQLEDQLAREPAPHIAVVTLGVQDRTPIRAPNSGRRYAVGSDEWRAEYGRRIDRIMKAVKRRGVAVYWLGLPIMRRPDWNADAGAINEVFRDRAAINNVRFIDIYTETGDDNGQYSKTGPDITGKVRPLRDDDGIGFTAAGSRKVAFYVERDIKRDLTIARTERNVPLLGAEAEQSRISPRQSFTAADPGASAPKPGAAPRAAPPSATADTRAETARVTFKAPGGTETITLDIVRPAIPPTVLAVVTRNQSADKPAQVGETVADTLPSGLVVLRSVTQSGEGASRLRTTPTQLPFFRALVRGERLPSKPGRADDFRWPREDDVPPEVSAEVAQPAVARPAPKGAPRVPGRN